MLKHAKPSGYLSGEVIQEELRQAEGTVAWEHLMIPPEEQEEVCVDWKVFASLLRPMLPPPDPDKWKKRDGWKIVIKKLTSRQKGL